MTQPQVSIYQTHQAAPDKVAAKLLEKIYTAGQRALVFAELPEYVAHLNATLWTYSQSSFLPHGSHDDGNAEQQPIWLTHKPENPNSAQTLVIVGAGVPEHATNFPKVVWVVDGADTAAITSADAWAQSHPDLAITRWQQSPDGQWQAA